MVTWKLPAKIPPSFREKVEHALNQYYVTARDVGVEKEKAARAAQLAVIGPLVVGMEVSQQAADSYDAEVQGYYEDEPTEEGLRDAVEAEIETWERAIDEHPEIEDYFPDPVVLESSRNGAKTGELELIDE